MLKGLGAFIIIGCIGVLILSTISPSTYTVVVQKTQHLGNTASELLSQTISKTIVKLPETVSETNTQHKVPPGLDIDAIITATNKARQQNGLPPLVKNEKLNASAKNKVNDMIDHQYFEHTSPSGKSVSDLGTAVGYSYIVMGENLALGDFSNADELLKAWMASPGHRANILNTNYEDIGVDAAYGVYQGREQVFAVQHFGTPKVVCPLIDDGLLDQINTLGVTLNNQQKAIEVARAKILSESENTSTYEDDVIAFNQKVDGYNKLIALQKEKIATYNREVAAFNACLTKFQT